MLKQTLIKATNNGAEQLVKYFNSQFSVQYKEGINNLVTDADHAADKAIISTIQAAFPTHDILSEESQNMNQNSAYKWIIDPIDGTVNFAHGIPICCVSIGLSFHDEMILGVVFNPFMNELFIAEKDKGATLNGKRIHVSKKQTIKNSCLVTGFPYTYDESPNDPLTVFSRFIKQGIPVRRLGSAAIDLCWVAAGRFDGFYEAKLNPWDSAAGYLMVLEAGGTVTDFNGKDYSPYQPTIVASNSAIHQALLQEINNTPTN